MRLGQDLGEVRHIQIELFDHGLHALDRGELETALVPGVSELAIHAVQHVEEPLEVDLDSLRDLPVQLAGRRRNGSAVDLDARQVAHRNVDECVEEVEDDGPNRHDCSIAIREAGLANAVSRDRRP